VKITFFTSEIKNLLIAMKYIYPVLALLFLCFSCTKAVDFDQINDFEISPVFESSIVFFNSDVNSFIENGVEVSLIRDFVEIDIFNSSTINDNLTKVDLVFETENSLPRDFLFVVDFLDENRSNLNISYSFETTEASPHIKTFEGIDLEILKNTSILSFTLTMLDGTPINSTTVGSISLKSKGVFYFNIEK
jgi:hypothetical protein